MALQKIRKTLGAQKYRLLHGRRDARLKSTADRMRTDWIDAAARSLTPLPPPSDTVDMEFHTLCGTRHISMGLWSSWSMLRFLPNARLVVHSDGSLTEADTALWQRIVPGMRIVSKEAGHAITAEKLAAYPDLLWWSQTYHFGWKLGNFYSCLTTDRMFDADSDTLTFRPPDALIEVLSGDDVLMAWESAEKSYYAYPDALIREIVGDLVPRWPEALGGGFFATFRYTEAELSLLDTIIRRFRADPRIDPVRYWMHQRLLSLLAGSLGARARPLPIDYKGDGGGPTKPDAVMRHYAGAPGLRPRFFTEGVPLLIADARRRGHLPPDFCAAHVPVTG